MATSTVGKLLCFLFSTALIWLVPHMATGLFAQEDLPQNLIRNAKFEQRLGAQIPLDAFFTDSAGDEVRLADAFSDRPLILALGYYECPMLCSLVRNELFERLRELDLTVGADFDLLLISIDPDETAEMAALKRQAAMLDYGRPMREAGWHFWVGNDTNIARLADSVGFHYTYDAQIDEYVHPSGIMILTPQGKVSRYLFGIDYQEHDLRLGLIEASANRIGSLVDRLLLLCYHYDPIEGQYTVAIMNVVRMAGLLTVLAIATILVYLFRQERGRPLVS